MAKTSCHFWAELSYSGGSRTLEASLSLKSSNIKAHLLTRIHFLISVSLPVIRILCLLFFPSVDKVSDYQTHWRLCLPEWTTLSLKLHVLAEKSAAYVIRTEPHLSRKVLLCMKRVKGCKHIPWNFSEISSGIVTLLWLQKKNKTHDGWWAKLSYTINQQYTQQYSLDYQIISRREHLC